MDGGTGPTICWSTIVVEGRRVLPAYSHLTFTVTNTEYLHTVWRHLVCGVRSRCGIVLPTQYVYTKCQSTLSNPRMHV